MGFLDKFFSSQSAEHIPDDMPPSKAKPEPPAIAVCPHCDSVLHKIPTRKSKCPHCGKDVYVRSKQTIFQSPFLTESQSDAVDAIKNFEYMGLSDRVFHDKHAQLTAKFGSKANVDDTLWGLYNDLITKFAKTSDFMQLSVIYGSMAVFLTKRGKDGRRMQIEANKMMLRDYSKSGVIDCAIVCNTEPCPACKKLEGKKFTISKGLVASPPLPPEGCSCELWKGKPALCACSYIAKTMKSSFGGGVYQVN